MGTDNDLERENYFGRHATPVRRMSAASPRTMLSEHTSDKQESADIECENHLKSSDFTVTPPKIRLVRTEIRVSGVNHWV